MTAAGFDYAAVADAAAVDPKTVERWVQKDRVPHREHRRTTARLLGRDEAYLWPSLLRDAQTVATGQPEVLRVYPTRGDVPLDLWKSLITTARSELTLLSFAGLFLLDNNSNITELLIERAVAGVRVRILLGDSESSVVLTRGQEEGIGDDMRGRVRLAQRYLQPALDVPGVEVRLHSTTLYNSIYRSDTTMLVNMHMYGSGAPANPVMHLQQVPGGKLFASYERSIEAVWDIGAPTQ